MESSNTATNTENVPDHIAFVLEHLDYLESTGKPFEIAMLWSFGSSQLYGDLDGTFWKDSPDTPIYSNLGHNEYAWEIWNYWMTRLQRITFGDYAENYNDCLCPCRCFKCRSSEAGCQRSAGSIAKERPFYYKPLPPPTIRRSYAECVGGGETI
jgi:hypothetical protein